VCVCVCLCLSSVYCSRELIDSLMARSWPAISHNFLRFIVFHPAAEVCIDLVGNLFDHRQLACKSTVLLFKFLLIYVEFLSNGV